MIQFIQKAKALHCCCRLSVSDSFEAPSTRIASVFDIAPAIEPIKDMTLEERQALVKVIYVYELVLFFMFVRYLNYY